MVVVGTDQDMGETPILVEVNSAKLGPGRYHLVRADGSPNVPALIYQDEGRNWLGFVLDKLPAQSSAKFTVKQAPLGTADPLGVVLTEQGKRIAVELNGHPWTTYVPDDGPKPYFDPLIGPAQVTLTRGWPMRDVAGEPHDHPHHRSLWFAHYDVNKANTWDENPGHGSIVEMARPTISGGGPVALIRTRNDWLDRSGRKVCEDDRSVHFFATNTARVFDFAVTLKATAGPVQIGDNKDGVFGIRLAAPLAVTARKGGQILNSRGQHDKAAWGQPAEWVDYTGPIGGKTVGVAILNRPGSFRFPTTWHVRDYGLFAANPFGWHDFGQAGSGAYTVASGDSIRLEYRVILHEGSTQDAGMAARFQAYANPPRVTIQ